MIRDGSMVEQLAVNQWVEGSSPSRGVYFHCKIFFNRYNFHMEIPKIIKDIGFDFHWSEEKVWKLDIPIEEISINELIWHFDIPFWEHYQLKPIDVINNPLKYKDEYKRIMVSDLQYPLDIMYWKKRWLLLDGLHRLTKASILGMKTVHVRKIPKEAIPQISS